MRGYWARLFSPLSVALMLPALLLTALGIWSIYVNRPVEGLRQLAFFVLSFGLLMAVQLLSYRRMGRYAWPVYLISLAGVLYTLVAAYLPLPGVREIKGARLWIDLGFMSFQPAEMVKIGCVMVLARKLFIGGVAGKLDRLIVPGIIAVVPMLMILKQPDLGTALVFIPTLLGVLFVAGCRLRHMLVIIASGVVLLPLIWLAGTDLPVFRHLPELVRGYQRDRVYAILSDDPATLRATGFQQHAALMAMGSGGLTGKGAGVDPVSARVPEAHNDMILAVIGEQFGLLGTFLVICCYGGLVTSGAMTALSTREAFARLLAFGLTMLIIGQAFLNLMVALRMMPVTGVTLPFVSAGGTSLLVSYLALGILVNIATRRARVIARTTFAGDSA